MHAECLESFLKFHEHSHGSFKKYMHTKRKYSGFCGKLFATFRLGQVYIRAGTFYFAALHAHVDSQKLCWVPLKVFSGWYVVTSAARQQAS